MRTSSLSIAVALGFGLSIGPASAAPLGSGLADAKAAAQRTSAVQSVHWSCWWRHGRRHCGDVAPFVRLYRPPVYSFYVAPRPYYRRWF